MDFEDFYGWAMIVVITGYAAVAAFLMLGLIAAGVMWMVL